MLFSQSSILIMSSIQAEKQSQTISTVATKQIILNKLTNKAKQPYLQVNLFHEEFSSTLVTVMEFTSDFNQIILPPLLQGTFDNV